MNKFDSKTEKKFSLLLNKANIRWINQYRLGRKKYDFFLIDYKIIIEVDGDYWHSNSKTEHFIDAHFKKKIIKNDALKNIIAEQAGFKLIRIWESDIDTMSVEKLKNLLK